MDSKQITSAEASPSSEGREAVDPIDDVDSSRAGSGPDLPFEAELSRDVRLAAASSGCEILEAEFRGDRLQIVLEHPEGTTLTHCEDVSKKISAILDVSDFGDARDMFSKSAHPASNRKLYSGQADYERFVGSTDTPG